MKLYAAVLLSFLFLVSCAKKEMKSGIDLANFDTTVKPQDNFFQYVNGTWMDQTEIPADKSNYGSFTALYDEAQVNLRTIIEEAAAKENKKAGSDEQKVGDFYLSYMDSARIEELGIAPIEAELERISEIRSKTELIKYFAHLGKLDVQTPVSFYVYIDAKKSDQYISYLSQSGLGLPDRDYYFNSDQKFVDIRDKYTAHITRMLEFAGIKNADKKAKTIFKIEKMLAEHHWTRVKNRDRDLTYNKYEIAKLAKLTPDINWSVFVGEAGIGNAREIVVRQPDYLSGFNKVFKTVSLDDWKSYLTWKLVDESAGLLPQKFVDANFDFYSKTLRGIEKNRPRWKRAVSATDNVIGEIVGKVYVRKHFKPEAKQRMVTLVDYVKKSMKARIEQLEWMGPDTKQAALAKLEKFNAKIGYPDKWKDYSKLEIKKDDLIGNFIRSSHMEYDRMVSRLGQPIDRDEWFMTPQTVNAYYSSTMNEIVFPAAILQPPFFNLEADDAVNYGAIGAVIGHEITHGFDDQGRKSDGDGNLVEWWTEQDETEFMKRANVMVRQYNQYSPVDTFHVNGKLTLGENIADLGGLTVAYHAYQMSLNGKKAPVIDNFTGDQRFFLGWAQVWRRKYRDEELINRLKTDPHSPSEYRVLGVVSNMPEFYAAFNVGETDPMYRGEDQRVVIW